MPDTPLKMQIVLDAAQRPRLFRWCGVPAESALDVWLGSQWFEVPGDLIAFWRSTGGGEAFETEQLLAPITPSDLTDSLGARNEWHRDKGMPQDFVIFHEGSWLSAVRHMEPRYVTLSPRYAVEGSYGSFDDWYRRTLRGEYAPRYGLGAETT